MAGQAVPLSIVVKVDAVEAAQAPAGAQPQKSLVVLQDGGNLRLWQALLQRPATEIILLRLRKKGSGEQAKQL